MFFRRPDFFFSAVRSGRSIQNRAPASDGRGNGGMAPASGSQHGCDLTHWLCYHSTHAINFAMHWSVGDVLRYVHAAQRNSPAASMKRCQRLAAKRSGAGSSLRSSGPSSSCMLTLSQCWHLLDMNERLRGVLLPVPVLPP